MDCDESCDLVGISVEIPLADATFSVADEFIKIVKAKVVKLASEPSVSVNRYFEEYLNISVWNNLLWWR